MGEKGEVNSMCQGHMVWPKAALPLERIQGFNLVPNSKIASKDCYVLIVCVLNYIAEFHNCELYLKEFIVQ